VAIAPGTCAEIATGAPLPAGADAVVMVEATTPGRDGHVLVFESVPTGQHVGRRGADIAAGATVVRRGDHLNPGRVGALAAIGCDALDVFMQPLQPRVAILSTGNEVVEPGRPLRPGQIFDVNRFTLAAIVSAHGGVADTRPPAADTVEGLIQALDGCAQADTIVFSGGSSVGERDLIADLVAARGEMIFHGIAIKPGKPTAFARVAGVARTTDQVTRRAPSVLHGQTRERRGVPRVQGLRGDYEPVAGRRLHPDSGRPERRGGRRGGRGDALLIG
jgi:molybdenum cofactor synthesis domain-containing protein